jgi:hypothetical protein
VYARTSSGLARSRLTTKYEVRAGGRESGRWEGMCEVKEGVQMAGGSVGECGGRGRGRVRRMGRGMGMGALIMISIPSEGKEMENE